MRSSRFGLTRAVKRKTRLDMARHESKPLLDRKRADAFAAFSSFTASCFAAFTFTCFAGLGCLRGFTALSETMRSEDEE